MKLIENKKNKFVKFKEIAVGQFFIDTDFRRLWLKIDTTLVKDPSFDRFMAVCISDPQQFKAPQCAEQMECIPVTIEEIKYMLYV